MAHAVRFINKSFLYKIGQEVKSFVSKDPILGGIEGQNKILCG